MNDGLVFELRNVSYTYGGGVVALRGVDLTVHAGEKLVILGANGSGKSTLLKILDGLYFASAGTARAFGASLDERLLADDAYAFAFRRRVGLVFQDSDVQLFSASVWDEVAFGPLQLGLSQAEVKARVEEMLALLDIRRLAERPPYRLSAGEKKKVCLASVLAIRPEVLLMDEPTAGLDPRSRGMLVEFIRRLNAEGHTVLTATHDLDIVEDIADRVVVFDEEKRLVAAGGPSEVLADEALLLRANLVHAHPHRHGSVEHAHLHRHFQAHDHQH
ncbi:MAG: energy-coupling factor ABC transporter ATP-binding protein [Chloroflexi bacterium]|nr:energy-coupling factor ABC transporter ATP-binding protein [Chloroflexota bacterium]